MAEIVLTASDTAPSIFGTLTETDGTPFDLTDATVRFQMRPTIDRRFSVDAVAVVVDATAGSVRYDWQDGDLDTPGEYESRWRVLFDDNSREHTSPANTISVQAQ